MATEITWKGHTLYTGVGSTVKVGDFVATDSGLYEFFLDTSRSGGFIPVNILEEIVIMWDELNEPILKEMEEFFAKEVAGET